MIKRALMKEYTDEEGAVNFSQPPLFRIASCFRTGFFFFSKNSPLATDALLPVKSVQLNSERLAKTFNETV